MRRLLVVAREPSTPRSVMTQPARPSRPALYHLNGGGGIYAAAQRLALDAIEPILEELSSALRRTERDIYAEELVEAIAGLPTQFKAVDANTIIGTVWKLARYPRVDMAVQG